MEFTTVPAQRAMTSAERNKKSVKRNPEAKQDRDERYRRHNKEKIRERKRKDKSEKYLQRPVVAWDSEGMDIEGSDEHVLVMITNSNEESLGHPRRKSVATAALKSDEILEWLCEQAKENFGALHVIYGGSYDFNMWLRDLPQDTMATLYNDGCVYYKNYRIEWRQGKFFYIKDMADDKSVGMRIYDVLPFFGCSFVKACDSVFGTEYADRDFIAEQKQLRNVFSFRNYKTILEYNKAEVRLLRELVTELRNRLDRAGIRISRWDGPGAIAAFLLSKYNVKEAMAEVPEAIAKAAQYAYSGGRFEILKWGAVYSCQSFEYDLNSAYPYAMQFLPNLNNGEWIHRTTAKQPKDPKEFGLYRVKFEFREHPSRYNFKTDDVRPFPLFFRSPKDGSMSYPRSTQGWYWASEVRAAIEYCKRYPQWRIHIYESYVFLEENPNNRPFSFVTDLYRERQRLKKMGDGAQMGIKLGLNSLYGKMAQQVGWFFDKQGELHKPPFHQIEWAGYVTAMCRSTVYMACIDDLDCVIAYQTDALFTNKKLTHLDTSDGLGNWEETVFDSLTMVQSGVYFCTENGNETGTEEPIQTNKTRGFDRGTLTREKAEWGMRWDKDVKAQHTSFYRIGLALHQDWNKWCKWITQPRVLNPLTWSKRIHMPDFCPLCREGGYWTKDGIDISVWHPTWVGGDIENMGQMNAPFHIEWLDGKDESDFTLDWKESREEALYE